MPEPLTQHNLDIWIAYNTLSASMNSWRNTFYSLGDAILANNWAQAQTECYQLGDEFSTLVRADLCDSGGVKGKTYQSLDWIDDNWPADGDEYELTMSKILDALWDAEPHQCLLFVPMIDAMRGAISEKTVTEQWMSNALRHFL